MSEDTDYSEISDKTYNEVQADIVSDFEKEITKLKTENEKLKLRLEDSKLNFKRMDEIISELEAENTELVDSTMLKNVVKRTSEITKLREQVKDYEQALEGITRLTAYAGTPTKEITDYLIKQAGYKCSDIAREVLKKWSES